MIKKQITAKEPPLVKEGGSQAGLYIVDMLLKECKLNTLRAEKLKAVLEEEGATYTPSEALSEAAQIGERIEQAITYVIGLRAFRNFKKEALESLGA